MKYFFAVIGILLFCRCQDVMNGGRKIGSPIPSIDILLKDSVTVFNTSKDKNANSVVLLFFDPSCPYCQKEVRSVVKNIDKFHETQFCLLSIASLQDIREFCRQFNLDKYQNIVVGRDIKAGYIQYFNISSVPHTSIYSVGHGLRKTFSSTVEAERILKAL